MKLAREYRQQFIGYLGPETDREFRLLWLYADNPRMQHVERFRTYDDVAASLWQRGLALEYLPQGFIESIWAGLYERRYRSRGRAMNC